MKYIKFLLTGTFFGIILSKSEVISWYRIYEMFNFGSFHMFGVIGSAVISGIIIIQIIKRKGLKTYDGEEMDLTPKKMSISRYLLGGIIFGLGWALVGACPGPMFILVGKGVTVMLIVIVSGTVGTLVYGMIKDKLPH